MVILIIFFDELKLVNDYFIFVFFFGQGLDIIVMVSYSVFEIVVFFGFEWLLIFIWEFFMEFRKLRIFVIYI